MAGFYLSCLSVLYIRMCIHICAYLLVPQHTCGGQRTASKSWFFPSTTWVQGLELSLSGMTATVFTCTAILLALDSVASHNRYTHICTHTYKFLVAFYSTQVYRHVIHVYLRLF